MQRLFRAVSSGRIFNATCSTFQSWGARPSFSNNSEDRRVSATGAQQKAEKLSVPTAKHATQQQISEDYQMVFKFPYIVHVRVFCRLKIYQTAFTLVMVPGMVAAYVCEMTTVEQCTSAFGLATLACAVLYTVSGLFRRFVGILYLNRERDTVKLAHLTFWGNRRDVFLPLQDIVPFSETLDNKQSNLYHKLKRYSTDEYFFYVSRFGGVLARDQFELIFGQDVPYPK